MKHIIPVITVAAALTLGAWTTASAEEEKEETLKMSDVPEAVQKTFKEKAGDAEIMRVEKEVENGKTVYEAVIMKKGKKTGIEVSADGTYLGTHNEDKEHKEKGEKEEND